MNPFAHERDQRASNGALSIAERKAITGREAKQAARFTRQEGGEDIRRSTVKGQESDDGLAATLFTASDSGSDNGGDSLNFLDYLNTVTKTAGEAYQTVKGGSKPPAAPKSPIAQNSITKYLPWIIGGGVVLLLGIVLFARRK